jgi:hypothetical protein
VGALRSTCIECGEDVIAVESDLQLLEGGVAFGLVQRLGNVFVGGVGADWEICGCG